MAKTYFHRSTGQGNGIHDTAPGAGQEFALATSAGGAAGSVTQTIAGGVSGLAFIWTTPSGEPNNADWPRGTYRCILEVSVAGADITYGLRAAGSATGHFARIDSAQTADQATVAQSEALFSGTGVKSATAIWDPAAGLASDRFECLVAATRAASHGNQDLTIVVDATDASATNGGISDGPFIVDAAAFTFANATRFANQSHLGPFKSSGGSFYTILRSTAASSVFGAFKATDPTSSWSNIGTNTDLFSEILSACVVQVGDVLHVATLCADSYVRYHRFNMATDAWLERGTGVSFTGSTATEAVCLGVRSDGDVVIVHKNAQNLRYSRLEAGTWTTDVEVIGTTGPPEGPVLVMDANDRAHMFWPRPDDSSLRSKTLSSTNGLSAEATVDTTTTSGASYTAARGISYDAAGTKKIRVPYQDSNNKVSVAKADSADSPTWTVDVDASDVTTAGGLVRFGLAFDGTTTYLMYVDGTTGDIFYDKQLDGGSWGVDIEAQDAVTALWLSADVYDRSGKKLAYLWDSNGTLSYAEVNLSGDVTVTPSTVAAIGAVPAPTVLAAAQTAPATVAASGAVPAATVQAAAIVSPSTVAAIATVPAPTIIAESPDALVSPATVAAVSAIPAATVAASARPTPATAAALTAVPGPTVSGTARATPATVAGAAAVPAPTVQGTAVVAPVTVIAAGAVPGPTIRGTAIVTPSTVAAVASVPTPAILVGGDVTVAPATVAAVASIPAPTVQGAAKPIPGTVVATVAVPAVVIIAGAITVPATVAVVAAVPTPTILAALPVFLTEGDSALAGSLEGDSGVLSGIEGG